MYNTYLAKNLLFVILGGRIFNDYCELVLGSHDQICATFGAGVTLAAQRADGMDTVECITAMFDNSIRDIVFGEMGYCVVQYPNDLYCTYIFNYTSNSIVNCFGHDILRGYKGDRKEQLEYLEDSKATTDILQRLEISRFQ